MVVSVPVTPKGSLLITIIPKKKEKKRDDLLPCKNIWDKVRDASQKIVAGEGGGMGRACARLLCRWCESGAARRKSHMQDNTVGGWARQV